MGTAAPPTVGIIANPHAGKDIRRLVAHASPTSDAAKIGIIRRAVVGAVEGGAQRLLLAPDKHNLAERAVVDLDLDVDVRIQVLDEPVIGRSTDTIAMAARMAKEDVGAVIVLGGDGTNRDVAKGWLEVPIMPISTGTNNVFPRAIDGSSAGTAAGVLAAGLVARDEVCRRAKRLVVHRADHDDDIALVDVAIVASDRTGARAVVDASSLRGVVAAISTPMSTGLSSVAGRTAPLDPDDDRAAVVRTGDGGRVIRVPLVPGRFDDVGVAEISYLDAGDVFVVDGPCVLAYDGERDRVLRAGDRVTISVDRLGPFVVDVERTLALAGERRLFDRTELPHSLIPEAHDGN